ncbi:MAG: alpha-amylase/alpha-mannosidase (GH57 family) [Cognaticolwellia sp.]|jgi:alpha-amylase/alpha-mannosidase (GH57 family)
MSPPRITVIWHMHQPDYRDPISGRVAMPFVRLHALRGYRDVAVWLRESGLEMCVNLVPSLLEQLLDLEAPLLELRIKDAHLQATLTAPETLSIAQQRLLVSGHQAMWGLPRAKELRARVLADQSLDAQQALDLQVWGTLAWVGWSGLRDCPDLAQLKAKGQGFDASDRDCMLLACGQLWRSVLPLYRSLSQELSTSPLCHPILPLLIDCEHAARCLPDYPLASVDHAFPQDALAQLRLGKARAEEILERPIIGLWPSEGSVSPELLPLVRQAGFEWLATDQGVLEASDKEQGDHRHAWDLGGIAGLFRDRALSDFLGFVAAREPPVQAAQSFLARCESRGGDVILALDGENPWEAFADAGQAFMSAVTQAMGSAVLVAPGVLAKTASAKVHRLHSGSWINADFGIWIGDEADRRAWALLSKARHAVQAAGDPPQALAHIYAAQGSDWFWWYGPEFETPFAPLFDHLFRAHLQAAWRCIGSVPKELSVPLVSPNGVRPPGPTLGPPAMRPLLSGIASVSGGASMHSESGGIRALRYGPCPEGVWIEVEGDPQGDIELETRGTRVPLQGCTVLIGEVLPAQLVLWLQGPQGTLRVPPVGEIRLQQPTPQWWA